MTLEQRVAQLLKAKKKTLAIAESCTGGLLSHRLTNIPGSSKFFIGSIIAYNNLLKRTILKIPENVLNSKGAVSSETVCLMAKNIRRIFKSDIGIAITGIAGPGGGTKQKPVGLVYISIATTRNSRTIMCRFKGNRLSIKKQAADNALKLILTSTTSQR